MLSSVSDSNQELQWSEDAIAAFDASKEALAQATLLSHPQLDAPTQLVTDASDVAVGAVLEQRVNDQWLPIPFFSKKLSPAETKYSTFDRELLSIFLAIKHFHYFVEGRPFHVLTDHKPLTYALPSLSERHSPRQLRHLTFISQFTSDIRYIKGSSNTVADTLSRADINCLSLPELCNLDFHKMAEEQKSDPDLKKCEANSSLKLRPLPLPGSDQSIVCDISTGTPRPFVPSSFRWIVFNTLYSLSHPGIRAIQHLVTSRFVWPSVNADTRSWTRGCLQCQRSKVQRHTVTPLSTFLPPGARFDHIHIDLVGPLPPSKGHTYLLTMVDRFTRWPEAVPLVDMTADTVARAFVASWVSRLGVPSTITTDRGRQFESHLWVKLMRLLGTNRIRTTAYHPCANGLVERFHRQLKAALRAHLTPTWTDVLPVVLLGIRSSLKADIGVSSAELVYGATLHVPGEFFSTSADPLIADPSDFAVQLRDVFRDLRPVSPRLQQRKAFVHSDLATTTCFSTS